MSDDREEPRAGGGRSQASLVRWFLLGLCALIVVALMAAWLSQHPEAPEEEPESVGLPRPRAPQASVMVGSEGPGVGWRWINPRPQSLPTWYGLDVRGERQLALVGVSGRAAVLSSGGLYFVETGTDRSLRAVAWIDRERALSVGEEGTVRVLEVGGVSKTLNSGTDKTLRAVAVAGDGTALVVGDSGTLLSLAGSELTVMDSGTDQDLLGLARVGTAYYAVGAEGVVLRVDSGVVTTEEADVRTTLRAVGGCGGQLYAVGDQGTVLRRHRTREGRIGWELIGTRSREHFLSVACDRDRAVAVGRDGGVLLLSGRRHVALGSGTDRPLHAVASAAGSHAYIAGESGRLLQLANDHVRSLTAGPTVPIRALGLLGGTVVAVGEWGRVLREGERGLGALESPTRAALAGLVALADDRLIAVGDMGAIVDIRHETIALLESPTDASFRSVIAKDRELLAVGTQGAVLRGPPNALTVSRLQDVGDLWGLAGSPTDAVAVGDGGAVFLLGEGPARKVSCGTVAGFRAVMRDGDLTLAVGEGSQIVRVRGARCEVEHAADEAAATLNAIGLGPNGFPIAVGDGGTVFERDADGRWSPSSVDTGHMDLRTVFRTDRHVYLAGSGGVLLRHVRLD